MGAIRVDGPPASHPIIPLLGIPPSETPSQDQAHHGTSITDDLPNYCAYAYFGLLYEFAGVTAVRRQLVGLVGWLVIQAVPVSSCSLL